MNRRISESLSILLAVLLLIGGLTLASTQSAQAAEDTVTQTVSGPFDKVVTNLKRAITGKKLVIVKEVPFQQMLAMVGLKTEKIKSFEIFHPRYGKVLYQTNPAAMKEAPLRIVVREVGNDVMLEYRKPSSVFASYSGLDDLSNELDQLFADIVAQVAK
jgi:uncharacterized protein (DUF302 family)